MATRVVALEAQVRGLAIEAVSLAPGVIDTGMQGTVRSVSAEDFVDVERFRQMKAEGGAPPTMSLPTSSPPRAKGASRATPCWTCARSRSDRSARLAEYSAMLRCSPGCGNIARGVNHNGKP
jgi:hypothetical protein